MSNLPLAQVRDQVDGDRDHDQRDHLPWRMGKVALDAGPVALAHLHGGLKAGDRAEIQLVLDRGGNAALFALPDGGDPDMTDRQWREFVVPVKDRTILVSDSRGAIGPTRSSSSSRCRRW